ncbi:MFS transporter [Corynebacterium aquilae]|uniref:MFS transporter n=1 Tax=Corynebacterium aquilae TaxID=203263 RepID=UPI000A01CFD7|nr:MFS transporter [Corynebacterium aquilae]
MTTDANTYQGLEPGHPDYKRAVLALLAAGLATFNALYTTQAILPTLSQALGASATTAAGTVSAATGALALCIVPASILSERFGRNRVMMVSTVASTVVGLLVPLAPNIETLIVLRGLQGAMLSGVPAVAMTWLSEELSQKAAPRAMGLYIAGTSIGGLSGRIIPAVVAEFFSWRVALFAGCFTAFACAAAMWKMLPQQRRFTPKKLSFAGEAAAMLGHWRHPKTAAIFAMGFVSMGAFVSMYNYLGYELSTTFGLSEGVVGSVFVLYLSGTISSARAGNLSGRFGPSVVLLFSVSLMLVGLLLTLSGHLSVVIVGLLIYTASFFATHSTASGWLGQVATKDRAEASSMYLLCYYTGSAVVGWLAGFVFGDDRWGLLVAALSLLVGVGILIAFLLWFFGRKRHGAHQPR